jgi:excinuclease ABC subunit A
MKDRIIIRNARQHNLKGIDVDLPRRALVVMTGPSGSGKSSLAFDTLYAEGQRRYVESLSTYAKQFLDRMEKPLVDMIEGISPAVAIEQKNPTKTSRSTVGTATETYDYLRLLWARAGRTFCPVCNRQVKPDTVQSITDEVQKLEAGTRIMVAFPLPRSARISHERVVENLRALGFMRVMASGELIDLDEPHAINPKKLGHNLAGTEDLLVILDRLVVGPEIQERLADSIGMAFKEGEGQVVILLPESRMRFSEFARCEEHPDIKFLEPSPRLFSFNNPYGSCQVCAGFGATLEYDESCIVPNAERSLKEGAVDPWEKPRYKRTRKKLLDYAKKRGVDVDKPWRALPKTFRDEVINGVRGFEGVVPFLESKEEKRYKQYIRVFLRQYQTAKTCSGCGGTKLRPEALYIKIEGRTIAEMSLVPLSELNAWLHDLGESTSLSSVERGIAEPILRELHARLQFLLDVGLSYLTLHRQTRTLSGGEAQRISLANSLGSRLVDTLYVLDEPTIGLHPRDTDRLLNILKRLRDGGNTVVVVEHDPAAIAVADHIIEMGPGSGEKGGRVVFEGTYDELLQAETSTGKNLRAAASVPRTASGGAKFKHRMRLSGARLHNLTGIDMEVPLATLTAITGVSGSGKSTLVHDVLYRALEKELSGGESSAKQHLGEQIGSYDRLEGIKTVDAVVLVDQSPIGKTPRSNPVTYIKAFDYIREIFAQQPLAKQRKYAPGHFSFNVKGGRCEACQGDGVVEIEMVFLADVYMPCEICNGARYKAETLEIRYKGLNIRQVLDLTIDEAIRFFIKEDKLGQMLWQLQQVGLGYLRLGQPAPTLSGGEAQRLKIARELIHATRKRGHRIYILDEPTTGLSLGEVRKLLEVIRRLTDAGHTAIVIEHNLEIIQAADWVIDLGPEGGSGGGRVVAAGTPREVARVKESHTGRYLCDVFAVAQTV